MKKEEIEFILNYSSDNGTSIVIAAVREANPMWKEFFDEGWQAKSSRTPSAQADLLRDLVQCVDVNIAVDVLHRMLDKKKPKDLLKICSAIKNKESLICYWSYFAGSSQYAVNAKALFGEITKMGLDLNHYVNYPLRRGGNLVSTPLGLAIHSSDWRRAETETQFKAANLIASHGAKFNDKELQAVMRCQDLKIGRDWIRFAQERDLAEPHHFLKVATEEHVNQEMVSLARAMSALTVCNDVLGELNIPKSSV